MEKTTHTAEETCKVASDFMRDMAEENRPQATVVALYGDLGSGKTTFVQGCARAMGINETIISPTFILERIYKIPQDKPKSQTTEQSKGHFVHIDCYRLEDEDEAKHLGWGDLTSDPKNIIFVEWAEKIEKLLPADATKIYFEHISETERKIKVSI